MLTAYDYPTAKILDKAGIDLILVGDSLAMVVLGHKDTKSVTMEEMLHHTKAVCRGVSNGVVVADMPIRSYDGVTNAVNNAKRFISVGADAVKIEGCKVKVIKAIQSKGIPVMGHIGLLPQTAKEYKVQGKDSESAAQILNDALELDKLGMIGLVIECVPAKLAAEITKKTKTPTIGIGAGVQCNGQVLVTHDLLGLYDDITPKFVKRYANLNVDILNAVNKYKEEVETAKFPTEEHSFK